MAQMTALRRRMIDDMWFAISRQQPSNPTSTRSAPVCGDVMSSEQASPLARASHRRLLHYLRSVKWGHFDHQSLPILAQPR